MTRPLDPPHLHAAAIRFAPAVADGAIGFAEAHDALCRAAINNPACRTMPSSAFIALCGRLAVTLADAVERPALAAAQAVRDAMRPLLAHRRPRAAVLIAAYRAAGDDLTVAEIEAIAREEVGLYVREARLVG